MFEKLFGFISPATPAEKPLPPADANHVFGALMVRVAKADRAYLFEELEQIDLLLAEKMQLNPVEAAKFRADCERLEEAMPDTKELGELLAMEISEPERESMFQALWDVLIADGVRHQNEEAVVAEVAEVFSLSQDRAKALTE